MFRIGFGYDAHRLVEGRQLILGGVNIPFHLGLMGHSDADVLTHAIMDGILGALARGDIGTHFPDSDPAFKGIESLLLLKDVCEWVENDGFKINNIDSTIVAQKPKIAPHILEMREKLGETMAIGQDLINIKATTSEGMGFSGRGEGIGAYAVVSLLSIENK